MEGKPAKPENDFDLLIAGAGPAGCSLALFLQGNGLRIGIVEKDRFPRTKICGDALSGKVLNVLRRMPGSLYEEFISRVEKVATPGIRFISPAGKVLDLPFPRGGGVSAAPPGYVCRRLDFDQFLYEKCIQIPEITFIEGQKIKEIRGFREQIFLRTDQCEYTAAMIAGADGVHSVVRKSLFPGVADERHFCIGLRGYFEHVTGLHPDAYIELIFLKELLPGYFWIFPSAGGRVNAGLGMLQNRVKKEKIRLSVLFDQLIRTHPLLAPRFREATRIGNLQAHALPLGTHDPGYSHDRAILLGDAAFLVDPFTGEGIGNAMASAEVAARVITGCFASGNFTREALQAYDRHLERRIISEFRLSATLQKLATHPLLINFLIGKAAGNSKLNKLFSDMYISEEAKKRLTRPGFYTSLLFRR